MTWRGWAWLAGVFAPLVSATSLPERWRPHAMLVGIVVMMMCLRRALPYLEAADAAAEAAKVKKTTSS